MPLNIPELELLRAAKIDGMPDFGTRLVGVLTKVLSGMNTIAQQTNSEPTGEPAPPPPINALDVRAENGQFDLSINHAGAEFYRGIHYFAEHSATPDFANPQTVSLGPSRDHRLFLGDTARFVRAYAQYPGSPPGPMAYFGSAADPRIVHGGGAIAAAPFGTAQGSGTGVAGEGHSGFGSVAFRSKSGGPPTR